MNAIEYAALIVIIGLALLFMGKRALGSIRGERGSCRSCGDHCSCVISEAVHKGPE